MPLLSQWLVIVLIARRHCLHRVAYGAARTRHPLHLAALSGIAYWIGNTGIIVGRCAPHALPRLATLARWPGGPPVFSHARS